MNDSSPEKRTAPHVCPWWLAYTFDNPVRRLIDPPGKAFGEYVHPGMTVLDIGCGFGHFSIGAARMVGPSGRVVAADLQQKMLDKTMARAERLGLDTIITPHLCASDRTGWQGKADFITAANVVHETPDRAAFFREVFSLLKPGGSCYMAEPRMHVRDPQFQQELEAAVAAGFKVSKLKTILSARRALLTKPEGDRS